MSDQSDLSAWPRSRHFTSTIRTWSQRSAVARFIYRCKCGQCKTDRLEGAREYRCCQEVQPASGKLDWDNLGETTRCITRHVDYGPMTNRTILFQVGPLLKDSNGKNYKRPPLGHAHNE